MKPRIETFLTYLESERGMSANTIAAYRNDLSQFAEFMEAEGSRLGGPLPISGVDRERLGGYLLFLHDRGYAPASVARKVAALRSFFHFLWRRREVSTDPTVGLGTPEVKKTPPRSLSSSDVQSLFERSALRDSPDGYRDQAMLRVLYATGLRVTELVTLDLADVSLEDATARIVGRTGRQRVLPLDAAAVRSVRNYLDHGRSILARPNPAETALFLNHRGQRLTRQGFWLIMKALVKDCGLPVLVTPHTLRHTFATHRIRDGVALPQLQQLLGHASLSTTQMYAPVAPTTAKREKAIAAVPALSISA